MPGLGEKIAKVIAPHIGIKSLETALVSEIRAFRGDLQKYTLTSMENTKALKELEAKVAEEIRNNVKAAEKRNLIMKETNVSQTKESKKTYTLNRLQLLILGGINLATLMYGVYTNKEAKEKDKIIEDCKSDIKKHKDRITKLEKSISAVPQFVFNFFQKPMNKDFKEASAPPQLK